MNQKKSIDKSKFDLDIKGIHFDSFVYWLIYLGFEVANNINHSGISTQVFSIFSGSAGEHN
jgi:hypothetical protein